MRAASLPLLLVVALAAGCPGTQDVPGGGPDGSTSAGVDAAVGPTCAMPIAACSHTFRFRGAASAVSLRGDFAADGWTAGLAMSPTGQADEWSVTVDVADDQIITYKLVVDGQWQADPANPRTSPDGFGGGNSVVRVDCDACPKRPAIDWRDAVMYFVLIDRFADGDPSNNVSAPGAELPGQYQGGDLAGLRAKIEDGYFASLGVNTLWLSSPLDNADGSYQGSDGHRYSGYHGYWPKDLGAVEEHAGTEAELRAVIDVAHAHGLQVLVDYVMNHVHSDSALYAQHRDWFWPNDNGAGGNCVCGQGCDWTSARLRCWFDPFLPDFDFRNGDARRYSVDNAVAWAKRLGLDGFRLDAVKHIETSWLTDLRARLAGEVEWDQHVYLVGETFEGDRGVIRQYVDPDTMLDGQFDFPLRANVLRLVLRRQGDMSELGAFLADNDAFYGPRAVMSTFLGNHDVPRVVHVAEDTPLFDEWAGGKDRAWTNQPQLPTTRSAFERLAVGYALLYTSPGVPMLYYGDELGMAGAGDPDNRRFMQWTGVDGNQTWLRDQLAALGRVRAAHPALRRGSRRILAAAGDVLSYEMRGSGDAVIVVVNRADAARAAAGVPAGDYVDLISGAAVRAPLDVPARTALLLAVP